MNQINTEVLENLEITFFDKYVNNQGMRDRIIINIPKYGDVMYQIDTLKGIDRFWDKGDQEISLTKSPDDCISENRWKNISCKTSYDKSAIRDVISTLEYSSEYLKTRVNPSLGERIHFALIKNIIEQSRPSGK